MRLALVLCVLAWPALAQDVDCAKAEAQADLTLCAEKDWNAADAELNDAYKAALAAEKQVDDYLDEKDRGALKFLRQAQRDWITFRDDACATEGYAMHGGTAEPMVIYSCRARLTRARTQDLELLADAD